MQYRGAVMGFNAVITDARVGLNVFNKDACTWKRLNEVKFSKMNAMRKRTETQ